MTRKSKQFVGFSDRLIAIIDRQCEMFLEQRPYLKNEKLLEIKSMDDDEIMEKIRLQFEVDSICNQIQKL